MRDELLYYYERELSFLRRTGAEFARRYPKVASRLLLEPTKCDDPHVERLLEGFALLAARVHLHLEDDFPEFSDALLGILYPHFTRPIPSMTVAELRLDPEQGKVTTGFTVPRETQLYTRPVAGTPCRFRTCYDTTLWPLTVTSASWSAPHELKPAVRAPEAIGALRVRLDCFPDVKPDKLTIESLRLHLSAEPNVAATLYELLCSSCVRVLVRDADPAATRPPLVLPPDIIRPVGFAPNEGALPFSSRSFLGHRLLQEYFAFPDKYLFLDIGGFERIRAAGFGPALEIVFLIAPFGRADRRAMLQSAVTADAFRLGCTPVINLFPQTSEPVPLTQRQHEYLLVPDARRRDVTGVFSVEDVVAVTPGLPEPLRFEPLYSFRHERGDQPRAYWLSARRPRQWREDEGTDIYLSFVDDAGRTVYPDNEAATARLLCHNGDLPGRLPFGDARGDFELPGGGPVKRIMALVKPTPLIQPPLGRPQLWRLISLLGLNAVSLLDGGAEAMKELLRLHNFSGSDAGEKQIQGILDLKSGPCHARIESEHGLAFARGLRVELDFDEERFAGDGVYLLASVIEHFLGASATLNSFSMLAVTTRQRPGIMREWPPRAGWKALL
jgi:type VI secretion system protein ImpG